MARRGAGMQGEGSSLRMDEPRQGKRYRQGGGGRFGYGGDQNAMQGLGLGVHWKEGQI